MAEKPRIIMFHEALARGIGAALQDELEVIAPPAGEDRMAWLDRHGRGVPGLVTIGMDRVDTAVLDRLPDLRHIQVFGAGMDQVDLGELKRRGVSIENAGDVHAGEVADFAMTIMLAARRELLEAERFVREDRWKSGWFPPTRSLAGAKVGIAGLGHIGAAIARRVQPFDTHVSWWGPRSKPEVRWPRRETLLELAQWADILFVAVFAHDETRGIVDRDVIEALGPEGLLVNISRGFVVDEEAMIAALRDGRLGQAALDVFDVEPTPPPCWADVPNIVLTPHCAGTTVNSHSALANHTIARLRGYFAQ
ncbi:MAG: 2-hydroxyacid dehydrogenase [Sphingomonadales bacterium]|nr:MAG: 2-hydroxyacid dehydrogenase [Sphingomonadales bacterium]